MPRIVCADGDEGYRALLGAPTLDALAAAGIAFSWHNGQPTSEAEWRARLGDADGLVLLWSLPDAVMLASPHLRAISWVGSGVGTFVNVPLASSRGVAVCNTPDYGANAVAEHALGLMLALARDTVAHDRAMRAGEWPRESVRGFELAGKTLGVVGLGGIGARVAALGAMLDMRVLVWTRSPAPGRIAGLAAEYVALEDLFERSDVVSLHLAHRPATTELIGRALLGRMRPSALLINTARAELLDSAALLDALRSGSLAGAALDVFAPEPLPPDDPLRQLPNVILTPHVGFRTPEATRRSIETAVQNLLGYFTGRPQNVVDVGELRQT
jgi:phosphoglycerate dehydrogenase-like enzyme